jgi:ATP phosphoribosyltransferase
MIIKTAGEEPTVALRLAVQKDGRLTEDTLAMLAACGLEFDRYRSRLFAPCRNFPLTILYGRDDDIPSYVASGVVDLGIVGANTLAERRATDQVRDLMPLGFARCRLVVAAPHESPIEQPHQLAGLRVATSFPQITGDYFRSRGIAVQIAEVAGAVEMTPALGVADAIADLTATGSSLALHDLRPICSIMESEARLVAHPAALDDAQRRVLIERLLLRMRAVRVARRHKYVMMNAPRAALPAICELVPGLRAPTIMPLADPDWVALHTVVDEEAFWDVIERLRDIGASEILVSPIEKLVIA